MEYYVYVYYFNNEPIYVGKGKKNRYLVHLKKCLNINTKKSPFYSKLSHILNNGYTPEIKIIFSNLTEDDALIKERELQLIYGSKLDGTGTLFNYIECGKKNPILFGIKNPMKDKNLFKVWVEKYGIECANKKMEEYRQKMSEIVSGRTVSDLTKEKMGISKKKYWEDLNEELKNEFSKKISNSHTKERRKNSGKLMSEMNKKRVGDKNHRSRKCLIEGVIYNSIKEVCVEFNFKNHNTVIYRIKSNNFPNWNFL